MCSSAPKADYLMYHRYDETDIQASEQLWAAIKPFMQNKLEADRDLIVGNAERRLPFTIVRPNWYHEGKGTGCVEVSPVLLFLIYFSKRGKISLGCIAKLKKALIREGDACCDCS